MSVFLLFAALSCPALFAVDTPTGLPNLPDGAHSDWVVAEPEEIVTYLAFDPATVQHRLPSGLRFTTLEELATGGVQWARDFLSKHPTKAHWGVSFLEFVRMRTFAIDGRAPAWPMHGAAALWLARVAPSDPASDLGPGRPFLALDFWVPDRAYVAYMLEKGHYATYGDVRLLQDSKGRWSGSLHAGDLNATAECTPAGPVTGGPASAGSQVIFPPASSPTTDVVRVAFAGHRERSCEDAPPWRLRGTHPLARGIVLGSAIFQFGYHLRGGSYPRP
jgi:hypothetical protein